ncbi:oligosaccharide flippase family protein [Vibrio kanaloae]|uniref:oligosaccharide flippase family protein n=1 Tax=Vibrio kanaloae TaxID=170673 RepID=UPI001645F55C|nr:oligosaccharide flippase family protein [Vibrio kanaloae]
MRNKITINVISVILKSLLSLFLFSSITELTSPTQYAPYGAALVFLGLLTTVGSIGFGPAIVRSSEFSNLKINTFVSYSLLLGAFLGFVLILLSSYIESLMNIQGLRFFIFSICPVVFIKLISMVYEAVSQRRLDIKKITIIDFISYFIGHFLGQLFVLKMGFDLMYLVLCVFIEELLKLTLYKINSRVKFSWNVEINNIKDDLVFSGTLTFNRVFNYFNSQLDKIYVSNQVTAIDFAGYSRVFQFVNYPINIIGQLFDKVVYPIICKNVRESGGYSYLKSSMYVFLLGVVGSAFCYLIGDYIEVIFFKGEWSDYMEIYYILLCIIPIRLVDRFSSIMLNAINKPWVRTISQLVFISTLIVGLSLYDLPKINVVAIISVASYGMSAFISNFYLVFIYEK